MGKRWKNPITVQGVESDDGRLFLDFSHRDLPLPFRWDKEDDGAHMGAMSVGVMDSITLSDGEIWGEGEYGDSGTAVEAQALAEMGAQFLSADPGGKIEYHFDILDAGGNIVDPSDLEKAYDAMWDGTDAEYDEAYEWLMSLRERITFDEYEIGGITQVDIPCWPQCRIALVDAEAMQTRTFAARPTLPKHARDLTSAASTRARTLLRRIASGPARMPAGWFVPQKLAKFTGWSIGDDGQINGHLFAWDACHRGYTNACVRPAYQTDFSEFHVGTTCLDDDNRIRTGVITHHEGHLTSVEDYRRLCEDPMAQLGPVRLFADEFGVQACGGVWPDLDPVEVARALGGYTSGDWQKHLDGAWKLHGIAVVNNPGYPAFEEMEGEQVRMVASVPVPLPRAIRPEALRDLGRLTPFFDVPVSVHEVADAPCACDGVCGCHNGQQGKMCGCATKPSATRVLDLAQLDKAVRTMGPRQPVR